MQTETKQCKLNSLILKDGNLHLPCPAGMLPKELIETNNAAATGKIEETAKLLSDKVKEETGVPTLRFEVDMFDKRFTPGPEMRRIMNEYFASQ